jgi:ligand-binding sensor domain-containing protein/signal transduction histidine kinase
MALMFGRLRTKQCQLLVSVSRYNRRGSIRQNVLRWQGLLAFGLFVWLVPQLQAQSAPALNIQRVTTDEIVSEVEITDLVQDQQGFLWVGTKAGLFRYDGYRFVPYVHDPQIPHSLAHNEVYSLLLDRAGRLWVGLDGDGLERFDPQINGFIHYRHDPNNPDSLSHDTVRGLWEDQTGHLWIGTRQGGVNVLDPATGIFSHYLHDPHNPDSLSDDKVYQGLQDSGGQIWVSTVKGLELFDSVTRSFSHRSPAANEMNLAGVNSIVALAEDRAGYLWLGSLTGGLYRYDRTTGSFKTYRHSQPDSLGSNRTLSLLVDSRGVLWVGLNEGGLDRYDPATDSFIHCRKDLRNPRSLPDDSVSALFEDRTGVLWIGTVQGLCKYDRFSVGFVTEHAALSTDELKSAYVQSFLEDRAGKLWIGTSKGLAHFDPVSGRVAVYRHDPARADSLSDTSIYVIYQDRAGRIWVSGGINELNLYLPSRQSFKRYAIFSEGISQTVFNIYEDKQGRLLVSTWLNGLQQYDAATDSFVPFQPVGLPQSLNKDSAMSMGEDQAGRLWLGMRFGGLVRYDPATGQWRIFRHNSADEHSLSDNQVYGWLETRGGQIWVATANGLNRFEPQTESFTCFTTRQGLPDNFIVSLQEDAQGRLWLGTGKGLSRFDPASGTMRNYDASEGLPGNLFLNRAALRRRSGELMFGTVKGLVSFNPDALEDISSPITVALTEVSKYEQPLPSGPVVSNLSTLDFSWRDDVLTFEFAALGLRQPQKAHYAWRLEGHDQDWISGGTKRTATYTDLPGGRYTLRVKVTDDMGHWQENELAVQVNISTPPWQRWWAYLFYVLALTGMVAGYLRYRIHQLQAINEVQTKFTQQLITLQEAERKRIASELHDGLGQNLVIIKNRATLGLSKGDDRERVALELGRISASATQALEEVREITNNLRPQLLDRLGLTKAIKSMLKKVSGVIEITSEIDNIDKIFDENEEISIYRIVQESLNNIIKHSNASNATVIIKRDKQTLLITITDNGKGFDVENSKSTGGGFGLVGLKERTQLLGGEILIASANEAGTRIEVKILLQKLQ